MGHIFYVMGKSASGKDTIYKILRERLPQIRTVVPYTTRPIRAGERDGVEYYFVTGKRLADLEKQGKIIEKRTYQTIYGPWSYATVDDGQIDLGSHDYFMIGTLESYEGTRNYFGAYALVPLYIEVEDGERLQRALDRERQQTEPKYKSTNDGNRKTSDCAHCRRHNSVVRQYRKRQIMRHEISPSRRNEKSPSRAMMI